MPTEFCFKIQYFNFDWKITITLLHSHRNTQQWKVRLKSGYSESESATAQLFQHIIHKLQNVLQLIVSYKSPGWTCTLSSNTQNSPGK